MPAFFIPVRPNPRHLRNNDWRVVEVLGIGNPNLPWAIRDLAPGYEPVIMVPTKNPSR